MCGADPSAPSRGCGHGPEKPAHREVTAIAKTATRRRDGTRHTVYPCEMNEQWRNATLDAADKRDLHDAGVLSLHHQQIPAAWGHHS
jgi:hypothetical protein